MQTAKRSFDSNISNALEHNRRVLAYKAKEQGLRAACLKKNTVHEDVQNQAHREVALKQEMEKSALGETKTKLVHEHPNYSRSSHHYTAVTNYAHDMSIKRVFGLDGSPQFLR